MWWVGGGGQLDEMWVWWGRKVVFAEGLELDRLIELRFEHVAASTIIGQL